MRRALLAAILLCVAASVSADEWLMPREQFERFRNVPSPEDGSGSCVQASLSMCGAHHAVPQAESLLVDSPYGPAELGGSYPSRVAEYAQRRGMAIYNVEGSETIEWIQWALMRGCYVAITYGQAHMITAVGMDREGGAWFEIVDNNYPGEVRRVDRATFIREHRIFGGGWCVILDGPGPPPWEIAGPPVSLTTPREVAPWYMR